MEEKVDVLYHSLSIIKSSFESYSDSMLLNKPTSGCMENGLIWKLGKTFMELLFNFILLKSIN